jgi:pimeloyl-ACP methyl ester carboxylesterase
MTGDADLWTPPSVLRLQASHLRHAETLVIREAGHAPNWEQPEAFNNALLDFLRRHPD